MSYTGQYADGRTYTLFESWEPVEHETLQTALSQTREALSGDDPLRRLGYFYDPGVRRHQLLDAGDNSGPSIDANDLYAVGRLSITATNRQGRCLLGRRTRKRPSH